MKIRRIVSMLLFVIAGTLGTDVSAGLFSSLTSTLQRVTQPVTVIVRLAPGANLNSVLALLDGLLLDAIPGADTYLVSVSAIPLILPVGVAYLEPDSTFSLPRGAMTGLLAPSAATPALWYGQQPALQLVGSPAAHASTTGEGVVVADIDAEFDYSHPALASRLVPGHDFVADSNDTRDGGLDQSSTSYMFQSSTSYMFQSSTSYMFQSSTSYMFQSSTSYLFQSSTSYLFNQAGVTYVATSQDNAGTTHGTFTAGLIAATAPGAAIMPIRAFDENGNADLFTLAKSIRWAVTHGANVINMSWGTADDSKTLRAAIEFAESQGSTLVAAAGNSDNDSLYYPAAYTGVIDVAATDDRDVKADFSNYGPRVSVSAPGVDIISAWPGGGYGVKSGTSFSAPIVAGEAALLLSEQCVDARGTIARHTVNIDARNPGYVGELGSGRVDLAQATAQ